MDDGTRHEVRPRGSSRVAWATLTVVAAVASGCGDASTPGEYAWLQLGPGGERIARAITRDEACPGLEIDGRTVTMRVRAAPEPPAFPVLTCEATVPPGATRAAIGGAALPLPRATTERLALIGDTGCRIEDGDTTQACNDPAAWPFAGLAQTVAELVAWLTGEPERGDFTSLARSIAALDPDLIVHVGDYLYREDACPAGDAGCAGSPYGYTWDTIEADWFAPARPLLRSAPLALTRGNHESCSRAGAVWFRFLDPRPFDPECADYTEPYAIEVGGLQLLMLDSSAASDTSVDPAQAALYRQQFEVIRRIAGPRAFLVTHRPMWVFGHAGVKDGQEVLFRDNPTLQVASGNELPASVAAVLSGHVHLFQLLGFDAPRPPQIVVGNSGTELDPAVTTALAGLEIAGATVAVGDTIDEFGFATLEAAGADWHLTWSDMGGAVLGRCALAGTQVRCS
jgi:hypothetical protein